MAVAVVGTLDVHAVRAMPDEVLIGGVENAAYLANVCVADVARRRRVGQVRVASGQWAIDRV